MRPKYESRTAVSWPNRITKETSYGLIISNVNGLVGLVRVLPSRTNTKYYDEGGSKYAEHRDNVKMRGCPPPFEGACQDSPKYECYAYAASNKVLYVEEDKLVAAGVKEDFSDVPILFPTYVDVLDHLWRDEAQYGKNVRYDFQKHIPDGLRFVDFRDDKKHATSIGGVFYESDETGIYRPSPISREQMRQWETDRPPRYTLTGFGTKNVHAHKLIEPDQMIDYLRQIVQDGSMITRAYPSDFDPEYGPNMRRFVRAPEDISFLVPVGQKGDVAVQSIKEGDQIDTTNPLCVFGVPQKALTEQYTVYDQYTSAQIGLGGPSFTSAQSLLQKARDLDEIRWRDSAYIPPLSDETDAVVLARELEKTNPYQDQLSAQISEKALAEQNDAMQAFMDAVSTQEFQAESSSVAPVHEQSEKLQEMLGKMSIRDTYFGHSDKAKEHGGLGE